MKLSEITAATCGLDDRYNVVLEEAPSMRKIRTFEMMAESLENMIGETMASQGIPLMGCIITDEFIRLVYIDGQPETSDDEFSVSMGHMMMTTDMDMIRLIGSIYSNSVEAMGYILIVQDGNGYRAVLRNSPVRETPVS